MPSSADSRLAVSLCKAALCRTSGSAADRARIGVETHCCPDRLADVLLAPGTPVAAVDLPCHVRSLEDIERDRARSDGRAAARARPPASPVRDVATRRAGRTRQLRRLVPTDLLGLITGTALVLTRSRSLGWRWPRVAPVRPAIGLGKKALTWRSTRVRSPCRPHTWEGGWSGRVRVA